MLKDLRQYITNDVEYDDEILFFYMICQRMKDKNLLKKVLDKFVEVIDDIIDIYAPSYWITRVISDTEIEDNLDMEGDYIIDMLLSCFDVEARKDGISCSAFDFWVENRFLSLHDRGIKKYKSNLSIQLDDFLRELDDDYIAAFKRDMKNSVNEDGYVELDDDTYFDYREIKLLNQCNYIDELNVILDQMGYTKASRNLYFWAGYNYGCDLDYSKYNGFEVTNNCIEKLSHLPVVNDISDYINLFDRMDFEENGGLGNLIRLFNNESSNSKDVIF